MKYLTVCLFVIMFFSRSFSQETKMIVRKFEGSKQIAEQYFVLKSNPLLKHGSYVRYFKMPEDEFKSLKKGEAKLDDYIQTKGGYTSGKRDGEWAEYSCSTIFSTKGTYKNDKKIGIWQTSKENGQIIEHYDHDAKKMLTPEISVPIEYPPIARENGIACKTVVKVSYKINADCTTSDIVFSQSCGEIFEAHIIQTLKKLSDFRRRYNLPCEEKIVQREWRFMLEESE